MNEKLTRKKNRRRNLQLKIKDYLFKNGESNVKDIAYYLNQNTIYTTNSRGVGGLLRECVLNGEVNRMHITGRFTFYSLTETFRETMK